MSKFPHGVLTGNQVQEVFSDAKNKQYALPAVNAVSYTHLRAHET